MSILNSKSNTVSGQIVLALGDTVGKQILSRSINSFYIRTRAVLESFAVGKKIKVVDTARQCGP